MKRLQGRPLLLVSMLVIGLFTAACGGGGGGTGGPKLPVPDPDEDPCAEIDRCQVIRNLEDLQAIQHDLEGHYVLGNDIDASATRETTDNKGFAPIGGGSAPFAGTLDGRGHTITRLFISLSDDDDVGLFARVGSNGKVSDIRLVDVEIVGHNRVGGLAGQSDANARIENVSVEGLVKGNNRVGGVVGQNYGSIAAAHGAGAVEGQDDVGGLVGENAKNGTVTTSFRTGTVKGVYSAGGLVGFDLGKIDLSFSMADVVGEYAGGLVGWHQGSIENSYSMGSVEGNTYGGGLVGNYQGSASMENSYSAAKVLGTGQLGGLAGNKSPLATPMKASYWDTGVANSVPHDDDGRSAAELKRQSTFVGWDFAAVWVSDGDYPDLRGNPRP